MTIGISRYLRGLKGHLEQDWDASLKLLPEVDYTQDDTLAVYIDYNWRDLFGRGKLLKTIPFENVFCFL